MPNLKPIGCGTYWFDRRGAEAAFGFLLTVLYIPGIAGAATTPRWALLAAGLPLMIRGSGKLTAAHLWGLGFLAWVSISLIWTPNSMDGLSELIKLVLLAQAFVLGSQLDSFKPLLQGMAIGLLASSGVALVQLAWPIVQFNTVYPAGLFINSGSLAEISVLVLIATIFYRSWWMAAGLLPGVILTVSRGAWLALGVAGIIWLWSKSRLSALVATMLCAFVLAYSFHASFHTSSVVQRIGLWSDAGTGLTWLGHGIGSFYTEFAYLSGTIDTFIERPEHLHNDWLEILFEFGPIGALLLCGTIGLRGNGLPRILLAAFVIEACVGFPLHVPCTAFLAALCLGHLARDRTDIRDMLPVSRELLCFWHEWDRTGRRPGRGAPLRGEPIPIRAKV